MNIAEMVWRDLKGSQKHMPAQAKLDLPRSIPKQIEQGTKVVTMANKVLTDKATVTALTTPTTTLADLQATALEARRLSTQATADVVAAAELQRVAYGNVANVVNTEADGDAGFIMSCGFNVRATPSPIPEISEPPKELRTSINGVPGRIVLGWKGVLGARIYEAQYTTDLTGATGWTTVESTPSKSRVNVDGLTSGTKYALRVRGLGNGRPGPWSGPVQQMAA
jgi:hypothetical protein